MNKGEPTVLEELNLHTADSPIQFSWFGLRDGTWRMGDLENIESKCLVTWNPDEHDVAGVIKALGEL